MILKYPSKGLAMVMSHAREHLCPGALAWRVHPTKGIALYQSLLNHHNFMGWRYASVAAKLSIAEDRYM
jgi:hypothetical protein